MGDINVIANKEAEKNKLLVDLLKENWIHGRHVESERLQFTNFYGAIVAGTLSIIGNKLDLKSTNSLSVLLFLLTLSVLGFLLSRKWGNVFDNHMANVKNIVKDLSDSYGDDIGKYVELQKYEENSLLFKNVKGQKTSSIVFML